MSTRRFLAGSLLLLLLVPTTGRGGEPFRFPEAKQGKGELKYVNGVPVLMVEGTPEEIGKQVGILAIKPAPQILNVIQEFLKVRGLDKAWPWLVKVCNSMVPQFPPDHLKELEAAAKSSGIDRDHFIVVNTAYDIIKVSGCSTLVVAPEKSVSGTPLFGRNLDFFLIAQVNEYSLVTIYRPKGKHAFASIGFPGIFGCMSGMNDAGLALASNEVKSSKDGSPKYDLKATPLVLAFRQILEECTTVEEVEKFLRSMRRSSTVNLTVCDKKGGVVFEITPKNVIVRRPEGGILTCTNHFRAKELATNTQCRRYEILQGSRELGKLDLKDVAKKLDEANQGTNTIQTMIFEPAALRLHVALGQVPTSAQPLRVLDLGAIFKGNNE
jgi:predicted choloylglycine hydrolase